MHLNYKNLAAFAANPQSRNKSASSASEVLSSYYMGLISSLIYEGEKITESEMAVISMSIGRWLKSRAKTKNVPTPIQKGRIFAFIFFLASAINTKGRPTEINKEKTIPKIETMFTVCVMIFSLTFYLYTL